MADSTPTYSSITNPYNDNLVRAPDSLDMAVGGLTNSSAQAGGNTADSNTSSGGSTQQATVGTGGAMTDVIINSSIQSFNWQPKKVGFKIDGQTGYAEFANIAITGGISGAFIDIPNAASVNSFHADTLGNTWWGTTTALFNADHNNAVAYVLNTGVAKFQNITITGGSVATGTLNKGVMGWTTNIVFTSANATQINWTSGVIKMQDGTAYNINSGNTGAMVTATYIYLDLAVSTTVLQTTTSYTTAVADGKVLIATAQNNTTGASVVPFGGGQPVLDGTSNIVAGSIMANAIAAGAVTANKISVTNLQAVQTNTGSLSVTGALTVSSAGSIGSGQSAYNTGTGFWLEYNGGTPRLSIGDGASNSLTWNGSALAITGAISGGSISIGSGNNVFKADANGIYLGNATFLSAPFRVDMTGALTASSVTLTNASVGAGSSWTGNTIASTYIGNLDAGKITSGTITIGGASQPANLTIIESSAGGAGATTSLLNWKSSGGTLRGKIWADTSGYMGYNAIGGDHYFYTNNNENVIIYDGLQTRFNYGVSSYGSLNVHASDSRLEGTVYLYSANNNQYIWGNDGSDTVVGAGTYFYVKIGSYPGSEAVKVSSVGMTLQGYLYQPNSQHIYLGAYDFNLNSNKTAIVPTSRGFNALYSMESPEVWFMDFCDADAIVDPMFMEVTVPPYRFIKCEDGGFQIWGKRKDHEKYRFESKSDEEFRANERFLSLSRP